MIYLESDYNKLRDVCKSIAKKNLAINIVGGHGWLGSSLEAILDYFEVPCTVWNKWRPGEHFYYNSEIMNHKKVVVINAAAKTNTRWCEVPENRNEVYNVNADLPLYIMSQLDEDDNGDIDYHFIHISTGCIYDGNDHYIAESEKPNPKIVYSETKKMAEDNLKDYYSEYIHQLITILRPRMPFHEDFNAKHNNILYKTAYFSECIDEQNSMTYFLDIILSILYAIDKEVGGTFNVVNEGSYSPYRIAKEIWGNNVKFITKEQLYKKEKIYLTNTLLSNAKLKEHLYPDIPSLEERWEQIRKFIDNNRNMTNKTEINKLLMQEEYNNATV